MLLIHLYTLEPDFLDVNLSSPIYISYILFGKLL
jgi:hypothetical protein